MKNINTRILYLSHGGGPLPLLGDENHKQMIEELEGLSSEIDKPSAIILISAHWEEDIPTITSAASPSIVYDYYGFPEEAYHITYPCAGEPALATKVEARLSKAGIKTRLDGQRGFDHGLFIPLKIMYPEADIPCIQLSLIKGLSPAGHIKLGAALSGLDHDNLLIIGSGFSFHNMRAFFERGTADTKNKNKAFEQWLIDTFSNPGLNEIERTERLEKWEETPHARYCHPREEHLMPLLVCYGAAQSACRKYIELEILNKKCSFYLW